MDEKISHVDTVSHAKQWSSIYLRSTQWYLVCVLGVFFLDSASISVLFSNMLTADLAALCVYRKTEFSPMSHTEFDDLLNAMTFDTITDYQGSIQQCSKTCPSTTTTLTDTHKHTHTRTSIYTLSAYQHLVHTKNCCSFSYCAMPLWPTLWNMGVWGGGHCFVLLCLVGICSFCSVILWCVESGPLCGPFVIATHADKQYGLLPCPFFQEERRNVLKRERKE